MGRPEFHVRVTPVVEGSQAPYHAAGIIDAALIAHHSRNLDLAKK
jgi:hypothetical protein